MQSNDFVGIRTENPFYLVERVIDPVSDFIGSGLIGQDVRADKIFDSIGAAVVLGQDMVEIPSAVDVLTAPPNIIVGIAVSGATHEIAVEILGKFNIPINLIP